MTRNQFGLAFLCSLFLAGAGWTQTFEIGQQPSQQQKPQGQKGKGTSAKAGARGGQSGLGCAATGLGGWGGSIEAGRYSRAAETALQQGNYGGAVNYAQHLVEVAPNDNCNWFLLGYTARLAGKFQTSLDAYDKVLARQSNSVEALSGKAQTYMRMGKAEEAKRLLLQVIAANPRRPTDLAIAGELFLQSGDVARAADLLERSEALQPSSHAEMLLAIAYMRNKQPEKAKSLLQKAMKRSPRNTDIFRAVAQYYRESHDYKSAIATLQQAPTKNADVMSELGYTYSLAGLKRESAGAYEKAAEMAPKSINIVLSAAGAEMHIGNFDKTRTYLAKAEQLDPAHYRLHAIRGDLAGLERRDADAIREYQAALSAMPEGPAEGILYPTQLRLDLINAYKNTEDEAAVQQQLMIAQQQLARIQVEGPERVDYLRLRAAIRILSNDARGAESDLKEALNLDPNNDNVTLQYGNLLWKTDRKQEAKQMYSTLLQRDQKNRFALEALGYLSRDLGDTKGAEMYFTRMAAAYPDDYVPYVALGDLYTNLRQFAKAEANYQKAYKLAPTNPQIIAGASNAAIEAKNVDLAGEWVNRATGAMKNDPRIMRETERYLFFKGRFAESARLGEQAIQKLPRDRDAAVYLDYDLYNLGRYDEVLALSSRYETILPKEPNFPLLEGHVHRQSNLTQQAIDDFTRALQKDPKMLEIMVVRGYARNDMQAAKAAMEDFEPVLKQQPGNGIAHLGLAFSDLQLHRSSEALSEADRAEKILGENGATHLAKASAYRQMRVLNKAEKEFRLALKYSPDDLRLHEALADTLYHARRYNEAITELEASLQLSPDDPLIYANLAAAHARLHHRDETFKYIEAAERSSTDQSAILIATGDALLTLGDRTAAMERFTRALDAPDANRVDVRLEFAKLFVRDGKFEAAKQEVGLAFAESRVGEASPVTADNLVEAANIFLATHDFDLAKRYFSKAKDMGASDDTVAVGLAQTYIAEGDDRKAENELAALGNGPDYQQNYDYQLAMGNIYSARHDDLHALSAFAHASQQGEDEPIAERGMLQTAGEEGAPLLPYVDLQSGFSTGAVFEDSTIYQLDSQFLGTVPPRSQQETDLGTAFHYHPERFPVINGYIGERNFRGTISIPSELAIVNRNTYDTIFDVGTSPVLRLGNVKFVFTPGIAFTLRRDTQSPIQMNQDLFRQYLYINSSPLFNWISIHAGGVHETGPFTEQNLHSRDLGASLEFEVGRPWGNNALITGYSVRDLLFRPTVAEFFTTSTWAGLEHKFGRNLTVTGLGKYIRSWRVEGFNFAKAQILVPGARVQYKPREHWTVDASVDFTRGEGFHLYDNVQSGFMVSYIRPIRRTIDDGGAPLSVSYPLRISVGMQQQSFYNFTGTGSTAAFHPVIQISIF